jgi:hypothetical protein
MCEHRLCSNAVTSQRQLSDLQAIENQLVHHLKVLEGVHAASASVNHDTGLEIINTLRKRLDWVRDRIHSVEEKLQVAKATFGIEELIWRDGHLLRREVQQTIDSNTDRPCSSRTQGKLQSSIDLASITEGIHSRMQDHRQRIDAIELRVQELESQKDSEDHPEIKEYANVSIGAKRSYSACISSVSSITRGSKNTNTTAELAEEVQRMQSTLRQRGKDIEPLAAQLHSTQDVITCAVERQIAARYNFNSQQMKAVKAQVVGVHNAVEDLEQRLRKMALQLSSSADAIVVEDGISVGHIELRREIAAVWIAHYTHMCPGITDGFPFQAQQTALSTAERVLEERIVVGDLCARIDSRLTAWPNTTRDDNSFSERQLQEALRVAVDSELSDVIQSFHGRLADELMKNRADAEDNRERIKTALVTIESALRVPQTVERAT